MPTIQENQARRPEWFIADADLPADARIFTWQAQQPNPNGPGTIGEAWDATRNWPAVPCQRGPRHRRVAAPCRRLRSGPRQRPAAARSPWAEAAPATPPRHHHRRQGQQRVVRRLVAAPPVKPHKPRTAAPRGRSACGQLGVNRVGASKVKTALGPIFAPPAPACRHPPA